MLVNALPGTNRQNLREALKEIRTKLENLRSDPGLQDYFAWAELTVRFLRYQVAKEDIDRLVHTNGYERLLALAGRLPPSRGFTPEMPDMTHIRLFNTLLQLEVDERIDAFEKVSESLERRIAQWSLQGEFILPDTSFYIKHPEKLEEARFSRILDVGGRPIHILVPMVIIDELEGLKNRGPGGQIGWRAGYTLAVLEDRIPNDDRMAGDLGTGEPQIVSKDYYVPGASVTIEVVSDRPGHTRLPIADDEIIDRLATYEPLAARRITLLTYDTNQSMRARAAGVRVLKLMLPTEQEAYASPEPAPSGGGARARRRAATEASDQRHEPKN